MKKYFKKSISELKFILKELKSKYNGEVSRFNSSSEIHRDNLWSIYETRFIQTEHSLGSFDILIRYLKGKVDFDFPYKELSNFRYKKRPGFLSGLFSRGAH